MILQADCYVRNAFNIVAMKLVWEVPARTGAQGAVLGRAELVPQRHDDGAHPEHTHARQVDQLMLELAVKAIVQPRHEGSHDEEGDAAVVEPGAIKVKSAY